MRHHTISNGDDTIDSRDVIKRIEELESEREDTVFTDLPAWDEDEDQGVELARLRALRDEADGAAAWVHGKTLIRDSYFETYAREMAEDIGAISSDAQWPACRIDWEEAAEALQQDYSSVNYGDEVYWIRS